MSFKKGTKVKLKASREEEFFPHDPIMFTVGKTYVSKGVDPSDSDKFLVDDNFGDEGRLIVEGSLWEWEAVQE